MLRLAECKGLPAEATCGLTASSGFSSCIAKIGEGNEFYDLDKCFKYFTSFGGVRACDVASPCRDDYICLKPIKYDSTTFEKRKKRLTTAPYFPHVTGRPYDPNAYGQQKPDNAWIFRNDQRGFCLPPYFVFQFRSDRHPKPEEGPASSAFLRYSTPTAP